MTAKSKKVMQNGSPKESNALKRFLRLPVVNSACNSLQKLYTTTKEVHPLMALVCGAYERCVQSATSLVAWSMKPMAHQLGPPVAAVNALACQGLDRLEQKIPALHKPVEKVTSDVKDSILTYIQSAIQSLMNIFGAFGLVARNYEECKISMNNTTEYVRSSQVSQVVEAGVDATPAHEPPEKCMSKEAFQTSAFGKIRAFAATVSQHPYRQISRAIQHARDKGKALAMWIPSLPVEKAERQKLQGSLTRGLHTACATTVSRLRNAPFLPWNAAVPVWLFSPQEALSKAGAKVGMLGTTLRSITGSLLTTTFLYVPFPKVLVEEERAASRTVADSGPGQQLEDAPSIAAHPKGSEFSFLLHGERRLSRGHFPIPFINLDDPPVPQQALEHGRGLAFENEHLGSRKSAFSPYTDGAYSRRRSEGFLRTNPEVMYSRAQYTGLYSTTFKKD
ncbi:perilipin-1 isoform X1 [Varanus komodoensis]|uniref:perilipin-1 isoform X1 n=1 Tax=Varanus komodoensis TaxID=61221 RepID=UPI001CF7A58A|nr:perilipin-1 isoform X1 [Varanus komodoensis]XP_044294771.1 perilipin-1 isoform X1 [Varanus komodoensis]XP_044294772.1 perilipin-1 isoform X1 [Varanus komodoensis]